MALPEILTTPEVAALLGKSSRTVHRLVTADPPKLTPLTKMAGPNGAYLFAGAEVQRHLDERQLISSA